MASTIVFETQCRGGLQAAWAAVANDAFEAHPERAWKRQGEHAFVDAQGQPVPSPTCLFVPVDVKSGPWQTDREGWLYSTRLDRLHTYRQGGRHLARDSDLYRRRIWAPTELLPELRDGPPQRTRKTSRTVIGQTGPGDDNAQSSPGGVPYKFGNLTLSMRNSVVTRRPLLGEGDDPVTARAKPTAAVAALPPAGPLPIGFCRVELLSVDYMPCQAPYLIFRVEAVEQRTSVLKQSEYDDRFTVTGGSDSIFSFPLTSYPSLTDLHVHVFDDLAARRENPIGRVVVALGPLLVPSIAKAANHLCGQVAGWRSPEHHMKLWLVPPSKESHRLQVPAAPPSLEELDEKLMTAIKGVPGSYSLGRRTELGKHGLVELKIRLELASSNPLWQELFRMPWQPRLLADRIGAAGSANVSSKESESAAEKAFTELNAFKTKMNQDRLLRCLVLPSLARAMLVSRSLTAAGVASWLVLTVCGPLWLWPLVIWSCVLGNGILSVQQRRDVWQKGDEPDVPESCAYRVWDDQIGSRELGGVVTQGLQVQLLLYEIQEALGHAAAVSEKLSCLLTFADPSLSILFFSALLIASIALSLVLANVSIRFVVGAFGTAVLLIGHYTYDDWESIETVQGRKNQEQLSTRYGLGPKVGHMLSRFSRQIAPTQGSGPVADAAAPVVGRSALVWARVQEAGLSFFARIPTEVEMAHRFIGSRILPVHKRSMS